MGKTQLAERLGARLDATVILDDRDNPFLGEFYRGRPGAAFQAQLFFTLARYRQQGTLRQSDLFSQLLISNYLFDRDKIYAYVNLDDNELFIYQRLYDLVSRDLPVPDLVVYLQAPTELLKRLLRERLKHPDGGRPQPSEEYLAELNEARRRRGGAATITVAPLKSQLGVVNVDDDDVVRGFREAPRLPFWVNAGLYVLEEEAIARLPERGDHETSTFPELAGEGRLRAFRHEGLWLTVNTPKDLRQAQEYVEAHPDRFTRR